MRIKTKISNKNIAILLTIIIVIVSTITVIIPLFFLYMFPSSNITNLFFTFPYLLILIFGVFFMIYCILTGIYHFEFKATNYILEIRSRRTISSYFFGKLNYLEMPISTIKNYEVFNRPISFNTTLMVKVQTSRRKKIAKRFNFAFLNKKDKEELTETLEKIIQNNRLDG